MDMVLDDFPAIIAKDDFDIVDGKIAYAIMGTTRDVPTEYPETSDDFHRGMQRAYQKIYDEIITKFDRSLLDSNIEKIVELGYIDPYCTDEIVIDIIVKDQRYRGCINSYDGSYDEEMELKK